MSLDTDILAAIEPFRDAGFALHWLHPRQKRPIGNGWSSAPVASLADLRRTHAPGNNLGVRLGEPSALAGGGYLHVLDLDIRIPDLADEAWEAFAKLGLGSREAFPEVQSGSGGESRHLYLVTDRPFDSRKLAVSDGKHRGADGVWHHDWEIEFFGTGKQVAMPPSIHPDSGKPYRWLREFDFAELEFGGGPLVSASLIEALGAAETAEYAFETREPLEFKDGQLDRLLNDVPVSDLHYDDWVRFGQALHHQFGGSQEGFDLWLVHTKRSSKFGVKQTPEQQIREMRRVKWRSFGKYRGKPVTMATVVAWVQEVRSKRLADEFDDADDFDAALDAATETSDDGDDFDDLITAPTTASDNDWDGGPDDDDTPESLPWGSLLDLNEEGAIRPTLHNLRLIVANDVRTRGVPAYNEFMQEIVQRGVPGVKPPKRAGQPKPVVQLSGASWLLDNPVDGDFWTEDKDNAIRAVIEAPKTQGGYGIKVPDRDLRAAVDIVGRQNGFHPVREYLSGLEWDGESRVERLFVDYLGAPDDSYHRSVARIMMVAAVTRVHEPGHKFDTAVILEGVQGKRKSTFISILAKNWFAELDGDVTDTKAMVELLQGAWIAELNELGGFAKADVRHIKAFISRRSDKVRLAYAKRAQEYHRQSIFIGSTNDDVYLKDSTGGRRFLPVRCLIEGEIDTARLEREIDQLWAEALQMYRDMRTAQPRGTLPLYLADAEARQIAERLQESRKVETSEDALAGRIAEWLSKPVNTGDFDEDVNTDGSPKYRNEVCLLEIWCECLGRDEAQYTGMWPAALGRSMRLVEGWKESARRPRFGKYGQQRAFEREGWFSSHLGVAAE